jgi:hypothetical protein
VISTPKGRDQPEVEIFSRDVSDEALEIAGSTDSPNAGYYTLGACTGLTDCPG